MKVFLAIFGVAWLLFLAVAVPHVNGWRAPQTIEIAMGASEPRSPEWPKVRAAWLKEHGECLACGGTTNLNVHHIVSFSVDPSRELDPTNLCTLCTKSRFNTNDHFIFGHNLNWTCRNPNVVRDATRFREMLDSRLCNEEKTK